MKPDSSETRPHDYRVVCEAEPAPIVVGGQAVNLWALNLLPKIPPGTLVSKDLDVVVTDKGLATLRRLPGWVFKPRDFRNWTDTRLGSLRATSSDGRPLLVEILHKVHGLNATDLKAAAAIRLGNTTYRVLDPVAMLKAKAANVRDLDQTGRQDRPHLRLIAQCVKGFLQEIHDQSRNASPESRTETARIFSRAFAVLQDPKLTPTLLAEGITPSSLLPPMEKVAEIEKIQHAYEWQLPRVRERERPKARPSNRPKIGM